jgi:hypothetical protein
VALVIIGPVLVASETDSWVSERAFAYSLLNGDSGLG